MTASSAREFCQHHYTTTTTPTAIHDISSSHNHENLSHNNQNDQKKEEKRKKKQQINHLFRFIKPSQILFNLYLVYIILSHSRTPKLQTITKSTPILSQFNPLVSRNNQNIQVNQNHRHKHYHSQKNQVKLNGEFFLFAEATLTLECENDTDCDGNGEKICHENKCICNKDRPIEAGGTCLPMQLIDEPCQVEGQCMGGSQCIDGTCSCGTDGISAKNPSLGILYCHPKRQLNEQCNYDIQCPLNSYCSNECLCQNGFAPANIKTSPDGPELFSCLPITCSDVSQCESTEFYQCEDNKCKCLPTHFDPTRAKCYRLGSLQLGNLTDENGNLSNKTLDDITMENNNNLNNFYNRILLILNDLIDATTGSANLFWLLIVIILLTLLLLFTLCCCHLLCCKRRNLRRSQDELSNCTGSRSWLYYVLPCCFLSRKHHQEWDPADAKAAPPDGAAFLHEDNRKNNVNQKSFRRKKNLDSNADSAEEYDDVLDPKSSLVKNNNNNNNNNHISHSKSNDYQVIYFGGGSDNQKKKLSQTVEESVQEDGQFKINLMNGVDNHDKVNNTNKSNLFQNGTQNKLTNNNTNISNDNRIVNGKPNVTNNKPLDHHIIVPTNSTLV